MTRRSTLLFAGLITLWPLVAAAQPADDLLDPVRVGDRWLFEFKDELSGEVKGIFAQVVTDVSEREIVTAVSRRGEEQTRLIAFDRDWNRIDDSLWKYRPNDGTGIKPPLGVGKEWRFENDASNMQTGAVLKTTGSSKVIAQEAVTTPAGSFDAFKIETRVRQVNTRDNTRDSETEVVFWYVPRINQWVRRTDTVRIEGRTRSKLTSELMDFSRKQ